ncbi:hypothetical protein TTHERM_00360240 (macronuclear) [Tetrahymena thermophila SB210]|uniref:Uncharacterized protein n=1 Tax=Tetrahymena thermophila (strain SB210) TaxID=312017 RepID=Q22PM1_TETTS|nr:hypothetical protein TTHERM_00360240 [Tetrahymena thermophila SB210]EAR87088.1 hypothetical protein TTHERM_00360240 [Tetrahymena thermophila SB210]|eukprot:XP_001007333.1 hypothetical protein TTHERM_00360240 [Tetrahymena thermophila SB210]
MYKFTKKTHLDFVEFINSDELKNKLDTTNFSYRHAKVFDNQELRYKLLIIIQAIENANAISQYQKIMKSILRNDIILNLINQYYLDTEKIYYVFEMEYYDQSLGNFEKQYLLNHKTTNSLKEEIYNYFQENLNLVRDFDYINNGDYLEFYVMLINQDKIQIKLNLISPYIKQQQNQYINNNQNYYQQDDQKVDDNESQNQYYDESENEIEIEEDDEDLNQVEEEENQKQVNKNMSFEKIIDLPLQSQSSNEFARKQQKYLDQIQDIIKLVKMKIPKKDLSNAIQNTFSNILNFHCLEIFEIIQKHPKYKTFEVVESNESIFILNVNKGKQTILLEGYKACSVEQAQSLSNQYESIVKNKISSTFLNIEQIQINPQQIYVLVEKTFIGQLQKQQKKFLYRNLSLNDLKKFINYSYQLLFKNGIQITKINPENILIGKQYGYDSDEDNEIDFNEDLQNAFTIDGLSIQQFPTQYTEINEFQLHQHFVKYHNNEPVKNFKNSIQNLIEIFFQKISEIQLETISDVFNRLQLIINNLIIIRQYEFYTKIKISEKNLNKIQIALTEHLSCYPKSFKKILELSKINPSLQINSLVINSYTFPECLKQLFLQLMWEYENKGVEEDKLQELFLKQPSSFIQKFLYDLKVFQLDKKFGQIKVNVFYEQNENDQLSKIINLNEFNENEIEVLKNQNCTVLEYNFELEGYLAFQKLNILIFDENIYYLIGDQQYILLRYENYKQIQQLFEFSITLAYFKEIFGQNYLHKYLAYQTTNLEVWLSYEFVNLQQLTYIYEYTYEQLLDLQGFKSLIQLNLILKYLESFDKNDLSKIIKSFSKSNINTVKLIISKDVKKQIPKLSYFYKQKQIVNVQIKKINITDNEYYPYLNKRKYYLKDF